MTPQEFYNQTVTYENEFKFSTVTIMSNYKEIICDLLKEYAILMCQKQREICAEEAETKDIHPNGSYLSHMVIDEHTILNASLPKELQ